MAMKGEIVSWQHVWGLESAAEDQGGQGRSTSQTKTQLSANTPDFYGFVCKKCEFQECAELW